MTIDTIKDQLGDYARDIRLNLSSVLTPEGAPDLSESQIAGIAAACAYATRNPQLVQTVEAALPLEPAHLQAAQAAAAIMAMNNIYYRFVHLVHDSEVSALPAKLRMNVIGSPGIPKVDFELYSLAVSAINGCGMCMEAHVKEVTRAGVSKLGAQSAVRIAAVIHAAAQGLFIAGQSGEAARQAA